MKNYSLNSVFKKCNLPPASPLLYFCHSAPSLNTFQLPYPFSSLNIHIKDSVTQFSTAHVTHLQNSSPPGKHFPNAQTMQDTHLYTPMGPPSPFSSSHNCNHIFMYFVIVMKLPVKILHSLLLYSDRASVFSIPVYAAYHR